MKKILFWIILFGYLVFAPICFSDLPNIYIQKNDKTYKFEKIIHDLNGEMKLKEGSSYYIELRGKTNTINFSSDNEIENFLKNLFPEEIFIKFSFINVYPNTISYVDDEELSKIGQDGNSIEKKYFMTKPGNHSIVLKKFNKVISSSRVDVQSQAKVECKGKKEFRCYKLDTND